MLLKFTSKASSFAQMKPKDVLSKYDDEISGPKKGESFELGSKGSYNTSQEKRMEEIRKELQRGAQTLSKCVHKAQVVVKGCLLLLFP